MHKLVQVSSKSEIYRLDLGSSVSICYMTVADTSTDSTAGDDPTGRRTHADHVRDEARSNLRPPRRIVPDHPEVWPQRGGIRRCSVLRRRGQCTTFCNVFESTERLFCRYITLLSRVNAISYYCY